MTTETVTARPMLAAGEICAAGIDLTRVGSEVFHRHDGSPCTTPASPKLIGLGPNAEPGWTAAFASMAERGGVVASPVVMWALAEDCQGSRSVEALTSESFGIEQASTACSYLGLTAPGDDPQERHGDEAAMWWDANPDIVREHAKAWGAT